MLKYFDKDFLKFFLGFAAIISVSLMVIVVARVFEARAQEKGPVEQANVIKFGHQKP
jgi:hypothetical protein